MFKRPTNLLLTVTAMGLMSSLLPKLSPPAEACDLCGCYTPFVQPYSEGSFQLQGKFDPFQGFYAGAAEQYTFFNTTKIDGQQVANVVDQYEHSSISQIVLGYNMTHWLGIQINIPFIYRDYKRPEGNEIQRG